MIVGEDKGCWAALGDHEDHHDDDGCEGGLGIAAFRSEAGLRGVLLLLLPSSACICAKNFAISGSLDMVESAASTLDGADWVSVTVVVLGVLVSAAVLFGAAAPDDHSQPILLSLSLSLSHPIMLRAMSTNVRCPGLDL